jgi:hypothetical protein
MVANPFETRGQRREQEVAQLMDKLPAAGLCTLNQVDT